MKKLCNQFQWAFLLAAVLFAFAMSAQAQCTYPCVIIPNETTIGTQASHLAKITGAPSTALVTAVSDVAGAIGISINGGTAGNAYVQTNGPASCTFDGASTAGNYVTISSSVAGDCADAGATCPATQVIGRIMQTHATAGTYPVLINIGYCSTGGGVITGTGTANTMTKWTAAAALGNSAYLTENGTANLFSAAPFFSSLTATYIPFLGAAGRLSESSSLTWDNTNKDLCAQQIGNVRLALCFTGADAGLKIAAAYADLPSTGGTVDARGFEGAQVFSTDVFSNFTSAKPVHLMLGATVISGAVQQTIIADNVYISGVGREETVIQYTGSGSPVLRTLTGSIDPAASTAVVGVGTSFVSEVLVGDRIVVTGQTRTVTAVADNTNLTVSVAFANNANDPTPEIVITAAVAINAPGITQIYGILLENFSMGPGVGADVANALFLRSVHRSIFRNLGFIGATTNCLRTEFTVVNTYDNMVCSPFILDQAFTVIPVNGLVFSTDSISAGSWSSPVINPIVEYVSGDGIVLQAAVGMRFLGGTSESNGRGLNILTGSRNNAFSSVDFEQNTVEDILDNAESNSYDNVISASSAGAINGFHCGATCIAPQLIGGYFDEILIDAGGTKALILNPHVGTVVDNGTGTIRVNDGNLTVASLISSGLGFVLPTNTAYQLNGVGDTSSKLYRDGVTGNVILGGGGNVVLAGNFVTPMLAANAGIAIGTYAGVTAAPANGMIVSGNVGIGDTSPAAPLTVGASDAFQVSSTGGVIIGSGTNITKHLSATAVLDFSNLAAIGCNDLTITVTGAALGDTVDIGVPNGSVASANSTFTGWVSSADTVTVRFCALVSGDPASGTFRADVWQH